MASPTSSIRLPGPLKLRLDKTAKRIKKPRNWIITQALDEYLRKHDEEVFLAEARRQSLAASRTKWKDEALWERAAAEVWDRE